AELETFPIRPGPVGCAAGNRKGFENQALTGTRREIHLCLLIAAVVRPLERRQPPRPQHLRSTVDAQGRDSKLDAISVIPVFRGSIADAEADGHLPCWRSIDDDPA